MILLNTAPKNPAGHRLGIANSRRLGEAMTFVALSVLLFISMLPIIFVVLTAFKTDAEISLTGFKWLPSTFNLDSFKMAFSMGDWGLYFFNSFLVTLIVVVFSLLFNSIAGFAFARLQFRGRELLFVLLLVGMMIPPQSIVISQFMILRMVPFMGGNNWLGQGGTGILNTYSSLILPFLAGSFGIFLCRQFYSAFPKSLDDAARIDGCGTVRMFFSIYLPLSKQIFATLTILKTVSTWNDYFYPLIMTQSERLKTVQLALQMFRGEATTHYNWLMAATLLSALPLVIIFLFAQKHFVQGVVSSGMKN